MNLLLNIRAKYCFLRANGIYYNCQQKGVDRMAGNTTNISIRMDADLKAQADALFTELGMNLTTAFNIFVRQSLREGGIPFEVRLEQPNKDYKRAIKRGLKIELLEQVVALLAMGEPLPDKNRDHDLSGDWAGHRECHILPDWLLVYRIEDDVLVLTLARTGTHSDLFGK